MPAEFGNSVVWQINQLEFLQAFNFGQRKFGNFINRQIDLGQLGERQQRFVQMLDAVVAQFQYFDHRRLFKFIGRQLRIRLFIIKHELINICNLMRTLLYTLTLCILLPVSSSQTNFFNLDNVLFRPVNWLNVQ